MSSAESTLEVGGLQGCVRTLAFILSEVHSHQRLE